MLIVNIILAVSMILIIETILWHILVCFIHFEIEVWIPLEVQWIDL